MPASHRLSLVAALALAACSRKPPAPPATQPRDAAAPHAAVVDAHAPTTPPAPVAAPPPVASPEALATALATALRARRPRVEILPNACEQGVCVLDHDTPCVRASLGFASPVAAVRFGNEMVIAARRDAGTVVTRYTGSLWKWDLTHDRLTRLSDAVPDEWEATPIATSFGVVIENDTTSESPTTLLYDGHGPLRELAAPADPARAIVGRIGAVDVIDGVNYEIGADRGHLAILRLEGDTLAHDLVDGFGPDDNQGSLLTPPEGKHWFAVFRPHERPARLIWTVLPSQEPRTLTFDDLAVDAQATYRDGSPLVFDSTHAYRIDVTAGTSTAIPRAELHATPQGDVAISRWPIPWQTHPASIEWMGERGDAIETGAEGLRQHPLGPAEADAGVGCACQSAALVCGATRVEGACATVEGLATINIGTRASRAHAPSTLYTPGGRFRLDAIDLSVVRITRLRDGARLWVRTLSAGLLAQADDGAFTTNVANASAVCSVRWGASLLRAPVTTLAAQRASLERPTLVADFFSDRALPTADASHAPAAH